MKKRPNKGRKTRSAVRPPVIDLKAEEAKDEAGKSKPEAESKSAAADKDAKTAKPAAKQTIVPETKKSTAGDGKPGDKGSAKATGKSAKSDGATSKPAGSGAAAAKAQSSGGSGKMMAGGLALLVLTGIVLGGWLYREYGATWYSAAAVRLTTTMRSMKNGSAHWKLHRKPMQTN